jgi:hypothetical protein
MKWIKGLLVLGMVTFAYSAISMNDVEAARGKRTQQAGTKAHSKGKPQKGGNTHQRGKGARSKKDSSAKPKKAGFLSSIKGAFSNLGSKMSNSVNCRAGKGEAPGAALYDMASAGEKLTDAHVVTAHASPSKAAGRTSGRRKGRN